MLKYKDKCIEVSHFNKKMSIQVNYPPQTKFAKVMFSQVFVCPQGGLCEGVSVKEGVCPRGSLCSGGPCQGEPRYGYVRVVHILLEGVLVKAYTCARARV